MSEGLTQGPGEATGGEGTPGTFPATCGGSNSKGEPVGPLFRLLEQSGLCSWRNRGGGKEAGCPCPAGTCLECQDEVMGGINHHRSPASSQPWKWFKEPLCGPES